MRTVMICALGGSLWAPTALAAAPPDVETLKRVMEIGGQGDLSSAATAEKIGNLLILDSLATVDTVARSRAYPDWFSSQTPSIQRAVRAVVTSTVAEGAKGQDLFALASKGVSGHLAEQAMAVAAGAPAPSQGSNSIQRPLRASGTAASTGSLLVLSADRSTIGGDTGAFGHGNGVLDAGESAQLRLVFINKGTQRLYSTSLYFESASDCLYIEGLDGREYELPELEPGGEASLRVGLYASRSCGGKTATLRVRTHDTQRFPGGTSHTVNLKLSTVGSASLVDVRFDGDDFGHSEPTQTSVLKPGAEVEVSTGIRSPDTSVQDVFQTVSVPSPLQADHSPAVSTFRSTRAGHTAPAADDIDLTAPRGPAWAAGLASHAQRMDWKTPEDAVLFAAVDSRVSVRKPGPTAAAETPGSTTPAVRVDRRAVERILAQHVTVSPVVSRGAGGAAGALSLVTVDGFSVSVDDADELLAALSTGATVPLWGTTESKPSEVAQYWVRHYIALPVAWEPALPDPECTLALDRSGSLQEGDNTTARVTLKHLPDSAQVELRDGRLGLVPISASGPRYFGQLVGVRAGKNTLTLTVSDAGGSLLCNERLVYSVSPKPEVLPPPPARVATPSNPTPRPVSIEPGGMAWGLPGGQLALSAGKNLRVAGRLSAIDGDLGFGIGPRYTLAFGGGSDGEPTFELSGQALFGGEGYHGGFGEVGAVLALRWFAGPWIAPAIGRSAGEGNYASFAAGIGFYFPER